jgi:glycosyltransferase involved in cell wall biosynthesis
MRNGEMEPTVSIIIPNYNYSHFIGEALNSILKQSFNDYEVLVIDDGSTDNCAEVVNGYSKTFNGRLRYIYQKNQGVAAARNNGILSSKGEFITFLDADDILLENALEEIFSFIKSNAGYAIYYSNVQIMDKNMKELIKNRFSKESEEKPFSGKCFEKLFRYGNFIASAGVTIPKGVYNQIGLFDKRFRCGEDIDMWLRISSSFEIKYTDLIVAKLRRHETSLSFNGIAAVNADLLMIKKLSNSIPNFHNLISQTQINQRLYHDYYKLGFSYILNGNYRRGRLWLLKALKIDSNVFKNYILIYFLFSFIGAGMIARRIRLLKHKIHGQKW